MITLTKTDMYHQHMETVHVNPDHITDAIWDSDFCCTDIYFVNGRSMSVIEKPDQIDRLRHE